MKSLADLQLVERYERSTDFTKWAALLLRSKSTSDAAVIAAQEKYSPRLQAITKAAVAGMSLNDPDSGDLVDLGIVSNAFIAALANIGVFDRLLNDMVRVPLATPGVRLTSTALTGSTPAEAGAKPVFRLNFTGNALERRKADAIIVVSDQFVQAMTPAAQSLLSRELRRAVSAATDLLFLSTIADGVSVLPSAGDAASDVLADIGTMLEAVPTDASSRLYLVVSATVAKHLATKPTNAGDRAFPDMTPNGGSIAGIPVLVSDHLPDLGSPPGDAVMLINAAQIAADAEVVVLDQTTHASLDMVDASSMSSGGVGSPDAPVGAQMISLWQTNSRGLRASRYFGFRRLRDTAVALLDGGAW